MLVLPIKKKWYDMILSGEKTEEYREIKPYYDSRFESVFGCQWLFRGIDGVGDTTPPEKEIIFRNGYSRSSRQAKATCTLTKGTGNPEWGAEPGVKFMCCTSRKYRRRDYGKNKKLPQQKVRRYGKIFIQSKRLQLYMAYRITYSTTRR